MTKRRRAPRKLAAARREDAVRATLALLETGGVSAASTPAIARRMGVTQSALFKHFSTKEQIWCAVMDSIGMEVARRLDQARLKPGSCLKRLEALLGAYLQSMMDIPAMPALLYSVAEAGDTVSPYLQSEISRRLGWFHDTLEEQLTDGQATHELRADFDPHAAATLLAGIAHGIVLRWRVSGGAQDMQLEARRALHLFERGVRA